MGFFDHKGQGAHTEEINSADSGRRSAGQKTKRHCARFWWLYLVVFVVVVLVVVLPVIYVGYPNLAHRAIKHSHLTITRQSNLQPAPDALTVDLEAELHTTSPYHPSLRPFNASIYLPDRPDRALYSFETPETRAEDGARESVHQRVTLGHPEAFADFSTQLLLNESLTLYLRGHGRLKQGGLPTTEVEWDQEIYIRGLNKLAGIAVTNFSLLGTADANGTNAVGRVWVNNPSVLTVEIGDLVQNNYVDGVFIANTTIPDLLLTPGNNSYPIYFTSNETAVASLVTSTYRCGQLPVEIVTDYASYNGTRVPWLTTSMKATNFSTTVDISQALTKAGLDAILGDDC
ncbi:Protein of unknown function (DUF3712) [Teratosphaeria destructans]|uniref:Uncharacterized protein n=1 Tax=Teratosphaeria destructans TaxID=418781 RepID=A0A9W7SWT2_9PEZI|nr:Protein of unknown function (DUF3712) [Teratosphaeria destructans]